MYRAVYVCIFIIMCSGCASNAPIIEGQQFLPINQTEETQQIILFLADYAECKGESECEVKSTLATELQKEFEVCIRKGLMQTAPQVDLLEREEWKNLPNMEDQLAELVTKDETNISLVERKLDSHIPASWVISMEAVHATSDHRGTFDIDGNDGVIVTAFGQEWTKTSRIQVQIWSVEQNALAGEFSADHSGEGFWMMPTLYFIPLIPIGWSPNVEKQSCQELGKALGRFFSGAGNNYLENS